jgi:hypothetical protein
MHVADEDKTEPIESPLELESKGLGWKLRDQRAD